VGGVAAADGEVRIAWDERRVLKACRTYHPCCDYSVSSLALSNFINHVTITLEKSVDQKVR
jgi:hypothetical protein